MGYYYYSYYRQLWMDGVCMVWCEREERAGGLGIVFGV